jgi:hypothetical protein
MLCFRKSCHLKHCFNVRTEEPGRPAPSTRSLCSVILRLAVFETALFLLPALLQLFASHSACMCDSSQKPWISARRFHLVGSAILIQGSSLFHFESAASSLARLSSLVQCMCLTIPWREQQHLLLAGGGSFRFCRSEEDGDVYVHALTIRFFPSPRRSTVSWSGVSVAAFGLLVLSSTSREEVYVALFSPANRQQILFRLNFISL